MRCRLALAAAAATLLLGRPGWPCGGSFGMNVAVNPQQDIIVVWKDGVETYVFQPIFCGTATDFGLILPVPAPLTQQPALAEQAAFTTLANLAAPEKVKRTEHPAGCGGTESKSGGMDGTRNTTTVVASGQVGFLEWKQLKSDTSASLTDWLTANGYPYSPAAESVFAYYVEKGWYFLAFRINQAAAPDGATVCKALGPIALAFPTQTAVVPTRMATAGTTMSASSANFAWRIFAITRGDVQLGAQASSRYSLGYSGAVPAADPSLVGLAEAGDRLTRLMVRFAVGSTEPDLELDRYPPADFRDQEYVTVYDDAACALGGTARAPHSFLLVLLGLGLAGLVCWRRWR